MAIPILRFWEKYFSEPHEGLGSTYERFVINDILHRIVDRYDVGAVLEAPAFGFTGLSGINTMSLALSGTKLTLGDHDPLRVKMMTDIWSKYAVQPQIDVIADYAELSYPDNSFDMSWSFSALWFAPDLTKFLCELCRVSKKLILIMVPNTSGMGYKQQKRSGRDDLQNLLHEKNIVPENFTSILKSEGWSLVEQGYLDCPPWPDIGMSKEDFCKKMKLSFLLKIFTKSSSVKKKQLSILDYYSERDIEMKKKMLRYSFLEKYAPVFFKKIWAHHRYFLYEKK
jgi:hypothetical protein